MIEPYFRVENEFDADIMCFFSNSIFAFDFKEEMHWVGNTINSHSVKKLPIALPSADFVRNKIALCANLPLFAFVEKSELSVRIIDAQHNKTIRTIGTEGKIECVALSDDGSAILIGGKNGSLSKYDIYSGKLLSILAKHKDSVLLAKESPDKRFVVSIGYDRSVVIFDKTKDQRGVFVTTAPNPIKCARFFDDSSRLILGDVAGAIWVIDTHTKSILHKIQASHAQILDAWHYKDSYIFALSGNGLVCLCDFSVEAKIMNDFLSEQRYRAFLIAQNCIILSSDKAILGYKFEDFTAHCENLIAQNDILEAYKFASAYKFLRSEGFYIALEAKFEADSLEAQALACAENRRGAMQILAPYAEIPAKAEIVSGLLNKFREIDEFNSLMSQNLELRAIPMAQNNPLIRELRAYKAFEERFLKVMMLAKEFVKRGKKSEANALVMLYKKIPSKVAIIQEILLYPHKVDEAIKAIEERNYRVYFALKKSYRFVATLSGAKELEGEAESIYLRALAAFYSMRIKDCKNDIAILKNFHAYRDCALALELKIEEFLKVLEKAE